MEEKFKLVLHKQKSFDVVVDFEVKPIELPDDHCEELVFVTYDDAASKGIDILRRNRNRLKSIIEDIQENMDSKNEKLQEGYLLEFTLGHDYDIFIDVINIKIEKIFIEKYINRGHRMSKFRRAKDDGTPSHHSEFPTGDSVIFENIEDLIRYIDGMESRINHSSKNFKKIKESVKIMKGVSK